jgi:hypothetical protein
VSENFQKTMDELGALMTAHSMTNTKLKDENALVNIFHNLRILFEYKKWFRIVFFYHFCSGNL